MSTSIPAPRPITVALFTGRGTLDHILPEPPHQSPHHVVGPKRLAWPLLGLAAVAAVGSSACGDNWSASGGDDGSTGDADIPPTDGPAEPDYTIVVLPDTQFYASSWPEVFAAQTRWLLDNRDLQRIAFVLHTGDIVDTDESTQWDVAFGSLHALDSQLPYVITAGNHDYANLADRMGMGNVYFPVGDFAPFSWFGGTFEPDHIENSYSLFTIGQGRWLVMALEFGPRDEVLTWGNAILDQYPDTPAIVITHAYLASDGRRYDHVHPGTQRFNPHDYVMMGQPGTSINDGEEMWAKLIGPHPNVKLVFSGHDVSGADLPPGTAALLTSRHDDGSRVDQILANYQTCLGPPCMQSRQGTLVRGGDGFLRLLRVSPANRKISVQTYSPYVDQFLTDPSNEFVLPFDP